MTTADRDVVQVVYDRLFHRYGPQHWWPAETPFEVVVGAILTQNTAWRNVAKCIEVLRRERLLNLDALSAVPASALAEWIRSSGYYNQKALRLKNFCEHIQSRWMGNLDDFLSQDMESLRAELLSLRGVGPETADSIVLYAAHQPSFVVDAYTHRIFSRHGWIPEQIAYDDLREYFMDRLTPDVKLFQEYHALLVRTGHLHCRRKADCGTCPLHGVSDRH